MDSFVVKERGRVDYEGKMFTPQDMAFPSAMAALKVFMGLGMRTMESQAHGITWCNNLDHYFHVGVSTEGFGMFYDLPHVVLQNNLFNSEPLRDCFEAEGLPFKLMADSSVQVKDGECHTKQELINVIVEHISQNLPAIVLTNENMVILATGYQDNGETLRGWVFMDGADNTNKAFNPDLCQYINHWTKSVFGIILVGEPQQPVDRKKIALKALSRGLQMLKTEQCSTKGLKYGYGKVLYKNWSKCILNDATFSSDVSKRPCVDPEIWDLAERRAWSAHFFKDAEQYIGEGVLTDAFEAFMTIHNKMWEINGLCGDKNLEQLKMRETRLKIVEILEQCEKLEDKAIECISIVESVEHASIN
jgi:hypothetical protein